MTLRAFALLESDNPDAVSTKRLQDFVRAVYCLTSIRA